MDIPIKLNPRLARAIETLAKSSLTYSQNHMQVRNAITGLILVLDSEAGEPSVEVANLRNLLRRNDVTFDFAETIRTSSDPNGRPPATLDPIHELGLGANPKISPEQQASAYTIKKIWSCFSRYLSVQAKNLEANGSSIGRRLDPIDVMGQDIAKLWKDVYCVWYNNGKRKYIGRSGITEVEVSIRVVVDGVFPHEVDKRYSLANGACLRALQHQLTLFGDPHHDNRSLNGVGAPYGAQL
jgi:hypothetical protein